MRAEGVYRVILNVNLFSGMNLDLAQDKFVKFVAVEDGGLVQFAIKVSSLCAIALDAQDTDQTPAVLSSGIPTRPAASTRRWASTCRRRN